MFREVRSKVAAMMLASLFSLPASAAPLAATDESAGQGQEEESPEPGQDNAVHEWLNGPPRALLTVEEVRIAERLESEEELAEFRAWFWARRDPSPGTAHNEFRREFEGRVDYANKEFGNPGSARSGWTTTRGLIHVLLGPPRQIVTEKFAVNVAGAYRDRTVWVYAREDLAPGSSAELRIPLVKTRTGTALLTARGVTEPDAGLRRALGLAGLDAIRHPDLAYGSSPAAVATPRPLAVRGSVRLTQSGLEGNLSLRATELYGEIQQDRLRVRLELRLDYGVKEGTTKGNSEDASVLVESGADGLGSELLAVLIIKLGIEDIARASDRDVRVVFWLPRSAIAASSDLSLQLIERPTGRVASIVVHETEVEIPERYPVERLLSTGYVAGGRGLAMAFLEPDGDSADSVDFLVLVRPRGAAGRAALLMKSADQPALLVLSAEAGR